MKDEGPEVEVKVENATDEENSSSCESENYVDTTTMIVINSEVQVQEVMPSRSEQVFQTRPSRIAVLQECCQTSSEVQKKPQVVQPEVKVPSKLQLTGQYLKIAIPSTEKVSDERWYKYYEMKDARREAKELKREERSRNPPQRYGQSYSHNSTFFAKEPETHNQAISSCEKENWLQAMQDELKSLSKTNTWTLVERPKNKNVIPGKSVYKVKTKADGNLEKYKARYVAKSFKQIEGLDYSETFAPTSKPESFRIMPSLAAKENFTLRQVDLKSATYIHKSNKRYTSSNRLALRKQTARETSLSVNLTRQSTD